MHGDRKGCSQRAGGLECLWDEGKSFHKDMAYYVMAFWLPPDLPSDSALSVLEELLTCVCVSWVGGWLSL